MRNLLLAALALSLSACATTATAPVTQIVEHRLEVPASLLSCIPEPKAVEVWRTQRQVALHLIRLAEAGQDCRSKLDAVRELLSRQ